MYRNNSLLSNMYANNKFFKYINIFKLKKIKKYNKIKKKNWFYFSFIKRFNINEKKIKNYFIL
jgi:hypothetical protein